MTLFGNRRPAGLLGAMLLALAVLLGAPLFGAAPAAATTYEVEVCTPNASPVIGEGLSVFESDPGDLFLEACPPGAGRIVQGLHRGGRASPGARKDWTLSAPAGATIKTLSLGLSISPHVAGLETDVDWFLVNNLGAELDFFEDIGHFPPPPKDKTFQVDSPTVSGKLLCDPHFRQCLGNGEFAVFLTKIKAVLEDEAAPTVAAFVVPPLARDTADVRYDVQDLGAGVAGVVLLVDGAEAAKAHDENGGKCAQPFRAVKPCRGSIVSTLQLDTTVLDEGAHQASLRVLDATGQQIETAPVTFTVHNAPTNRVAPTVAGAAHVGQTLTAEAGRWEGAPTNLAYQWLRCPASVRSSTDAKSCARVAGETDRKYRLSAGDLDDRLLVEVEATNAEGSGTALSDPSEIINPRLTTKHSNAPVVSQVSLSRKRFRVATATRRRRGRGSTLRFSCNKPGRLTLTIERLHKGKPRRYAELALSIKAGRSAVMLTGTVGKKRLSPGRYQVTLSVADAAGQRSRPVRARFTVLAG